MTTVEGLPAAVREFAGYLTGLVGRLDQDSGWCGVFWRRDPGGMQACLEGREEPPWDVVEALLQDFAALHGQAYGAQETERARELHTASLIAYDALPGARDRLGDRLGVMLREQRHAAGRRAELARKLPSAPSDQAATIERDLAWAQDDHARASARCAELHARLAELDRLTGRATGPGAHLGLRPAAERDAYAVAGQGDHPDDFGHLDAAPAPARLAAPEPAVAPGTAGAAGRVRYDLGADPADFGTGVGQSGYEHAGAGQDGPGRAGADQGGFEHADAGRTGFDHSSPEDPSTGHPGTARAGTGYSQTDSGTGYPGTEHSSTGYSWPEHFTAGYSGVDHAGAGAEFTAGAAGHAGQDPGGAGWTGDDSGGAGWAGDDSGGAGWAGDDPGGAGWIGRGPDASGRPGPGTAAPGPPGVSGAGARSGAGHAGGDARSLGRRDTRFTGAGDTDDDGDPATAPEGGSLDAGSADDAGTRPSGDESVQEAVADAVAELVRLRAEGRGGEAHTVLVEAASWPPDHFPLLATELTRVGLEPDWSTLLWEAASLPTDRLVALAHTLMAGGLAADGGRLLRQAAARPASDVGATVLALVDEDRDREARALLDACVRSRAPQEAARCAQSDPQRLVPLLTEAAGALSGTCQDALLHALRVAGLVR